MSPDNSLTLAEAVELLRLGAGRIPCVRWTQGNCDSHGGASDFNSRYCAGCRVRRKFEDAIARGVKPNGWLEPGGITYPEGIWRSVWSTPENGTTPVRIDPVQEDDDAS